MKKYILPFILLFISFTVLCQGQPACCTMMADNNGVFGNDPAFIKAHLPPAPFVFVPARGKMISFKTPDGKDGSAFEVLTDLPSRSTILMFHEWWGLNDYIKQEAERLSETTGTAVIALDLYDGIVTDKPEEAGKFSNELKDERVRAIISGILDYKGKDAQLQTIGWCMGGTWSLQAALMGGSNVKGCVIYYGMPEKDKMLISKLKCPVLGIFANNDQWITPAVVEEFRKNMQEAGKTLYIYKYNADHAFANPSNPKHDKASSDDAMQKAIAFIRKNFK